jgi:transcription-repair coupling factor (superfamily II helicase)
MEHGLIIDRLVCGDVGYGKTEVAMRIALKTVMAGQQVAYLAPTTILTRQHYLNFKIGSADMELRLPSLIGWLIKRTNRSIEGS